MENAVSLKSVQKTFNYENQKLSVLNDINYNLPSNAFHAVMGPSGSGKTTLMNIIAGLMSPDAGSVTVDGISLSKMSDRELTLFRRRHIGMIFQNFNLVPTLTVAENIMLPVLLDNKTLPKSRLDELLTLVNLTSRANHPADRISGGEAQRTAIARSLALSPAVIIADEPTGNLDSPAGRAFCELLAKLNKKANCAVLLVSHDPIVAAAADEVYLLKDGKLESHFATNHDASCVAKHYLEMMSGEAK